MKFTIVGSGAIGGSMGAFMIKGGEDVTFVDAWKEHVDAINKQGMTVHTTSGDFNVKAKALLPGELKGPLDTVFIATKSQDVEKAILEVKPHLTKDSVVVSMNNGQDNAVKIAEQIGANRTIGGFVDFGGALVDPGEIEVPARGDFYIGELTGPITTRLRQIQAACSHYGQTFITDDVWAYIWTKNAVASATIYTALADTSSTEAMNSEENLRVHASLVRESLNLMQVIGINMVPYKTFDPFCYLVKTSEETKALLKTLKANNARASEGERKGPTPSGYVFKKKASGFWWDLTYRKRKSEADAVFADMWLPKAKKYGVDMSLSEYLMKLVHEIEEGKRKISTDNYKEMYQAMKKLGKDLP